MALQLYRNQNSPFKTLNLDGVLFLINDGSDELGQHYEDKISNQPLSLRQLLLVRKSNLTIPYIFAVVPDKSVIMQSYLANFPGFSHCRRHHVNCLRPLDFFVDPLQTIHDLATLHNSKTCYPGDTHPNFLSQYAVYTSIMKKLGYIPQPYDITFIDPPMGDLAHSHNNGNRPIPNLKSWKVPIIKQKINHLISERILCINTGKPLQLTCEQFLNGNRHTYFHVYKNDSANNNLRVLIFHDSNVCMFHNNKHVVKEWYASHFKETLFLWSTYNQQVVNVHKPNLIIEISMERFLNDYRS